MHFLSEGHVEGIRLTSLKFQTGKVNFAESGRMISLMFLTNVKL